MPLEDKIKKFIEWLSENTDFSGWDFSVRAEVLGKLTEIMNEPEPNQHSWQWYMNGTFCVRCGVQIGSDLPCR